MPQSDQKQHQEVALFRYERIADLLRLEPGSREWSRRLRERAAEECSIPGSTRRRVSQATLRRWVRAYRTEGLDGLYPQVRCDRGRRRALDGEVADLLVGIKERHPELPVRKVIEQARSKGSLPSTVKLAPTTVYRLLRDQGLMQPASGEQSPQDMYRWGYSAAGDLWMSDVMHGPQIRRVQKGRPRKQKSYLLAFLDDCTRIVPHAEFAFGERYADLLPVFKRALLKRGVPERLYCDNGAVYRCHDLRIACANLNIQLLHARAYRPQGKAWTSYCTLWARWWQTRQLGARVSGTGQWVHGV